MPGHGKEFKEKRDTDAMMPLTDLVVLPGTVGKESVVFIIVILVAVFVISSLYDRLKKKKDK
jgi:hypothetical protein